MAIKVSIVEDNAAFRESLAVLLNGSPGFSCLGVHQSGEEALKNIPVDLPDVVLMDIQLPRSNGIDCVRNLKNKKPGLPVIMLTAYEDTEMIFDSLTAGACGYLLKRTPPSQILEAIEEVHRGGAPMSTQIARKVVVSFHKLHGAATQEQSLTQREEEILGLLAKGYRNKEIADQLSISLDTIRSHLRHIYEKLHVRSRTEAVLKYVQK